MHRTLVFAGMQISNATGAVTQSWSRVTGRDGKRDAKYLGIGVAAVSGVVVASVRPAQWQGLRSSLIVLAQSDQHMLSCLQLATVCSESHVRVTSSIME